MSDGKPGRGSDQFPLRFPAGMRDFIKDAADRNNRSMNAEIIARLQTTINGNKGAPNITVALEALPQGVGTQRVSVAQFLDALNRTIKETVEVGKKAERQAKREAEQQSPTLLPAEDTENGPKKDGE